MAAQPFYHSASVLFTSTESVNRSELTDLLRKAIARLEKKNRLGILIDTVDVERVDDEPGDPADL